MRPVLGVHWKDWCLGWNSNTLPTSCEMLTHWKRLWLREGLGAGGEGDDRGWDGWMTSPSRCTWVWVNSRSWWWTGRPGMLGFMGSQRVGPDWATELNWTVLIKKTLYLSTLPPSYFFSKNNCVSKQNTVFFNFASFLFLFQNKLNCNSLFVAIVISHVTVLHKAESLLYIWELSGEISLESKRNSYPPPVWCLLIFWVGDDR